MLRMGVPVVVVSGDKSGFAQLFPDSRSFSGGRSLRGCNSLLPLAVNSAGPSSLGRSAPSGDEGRASSGVLQERRGTQLGPESLVWFGSFPPFSRFLVSF